MFNSDFNRPDGVYRKERLLNYIKREIADLEKSNQQLTTEINSICEKPSDDSVKLSNNKLHGIHLKNFSSKEIGNKTVYSAMCNQVDHPFKLEVTTENGEVLTVCVSIPEDSPLQEIERTLCLFSEERCPHYIWLILEQFAHLSKFRSDTLTKLIRSARGFFQVYLPRFKKDGRRRCTVVARKEKPFEVCIEIQWEMSWDKVLHSLAHSFTVVPQEVLGRPSLRRKLETLHSQTFTPDQETSLTEWWDDFRDLFICS